MKLLRFTIAGLFLLAIPLFAIRVSEARVSEKKTITPPASNYQELIIQIPKLNEKNTEDVKVTILNEGGILFLGYCEKMKVMMFKVDRTVHPDDRFLDNVLVTMGLPYSIKQGTVAQVRTACEMPAEADPTQSGQ